MQSYCLLTIFAIWVVLPIPKHEVWAQPQDECPANDLNHGEDLDYDDRDHLEEEFADVDDYYDENDDNEWNTNFWNGKFPTYNDELNKNVNNSPEGIDENEKLPHYKDESEFVNHADKSKAKYGDNGCRKESNYEQGKNGFWEEESNRQCTASEARKYGHHQKFRENTIRGCYSRCRDEDINNLNSCPWSSFRHNERKTRDIHITITIPS